jgi:CO dehydrogenase/acetyl-CoA synthase gamma subunit (corrinoid Fe-S protein)
VHTHRHEPPQENGLPLSFLHVADLFDVIVQLAAKGDEVHIKSLKGRSIEARQNDLVLDPATMLIKDAK